MVDFESCWVRFLEGGCDPGAPGALSVGGVAEEGAGRGGEEGGFCIGEGYVRGELGCAGWVGGFGS